MKILVTGHEGFVGRNLVDALSLRGIGEATYGLDIRARNNIQTDTGPDLANYDLTVRSIGKTKPDVVVHLASSVSTQGSIERPMETFRNTVRVGANVIDACREHGIPLILTSSVKARDGMTPYGASKRMVELWAEEYEKCYGLRLIINRPGTIYGPGQEGSPESGWIAWFVKARLHGWPVVINGDGSQVRDLLYVKDYCDLLITQMLEFDTYEGKVWDVGGGPTNAVTVLEMVNYLGLEHTFGEPRYGDADTYIGENKCPTWEPATTWQTSGMF